VSFTDYLKIYSQSLHGNSSKFAFFLNENVHLQLNSTHHSSLPILKHEKITKMMALFTMKNSIILGHINHVIDRLIPSGILTYLKDYGMWFLARQFDEETVDHRRILSMDILQFGFVLWLAACVVSLVGFCCEIIWVSFVKHFKSLIGFLEFVRILKMRMNNYHDRW
jgi:hypothetical protein